MNLNNTKQVLGKEGERIAEAYLRKKVIRSSSVTFVAPSGARPDRLDRRVLVFVEVKTRTGDAFGTPFEAVEFRKQQKMIQAAQYFIAQRRLQQRDSRFDVVGISWPGRELLVEHIENAFELS
jgi:putative endonuclease